MRILLIEPDKLLAGSLQTYFANANHTVLIYRDLQAAITAADSQKPDVVIAELQLAGRSGIEFLYEFRSYPDWQSLPVIIYTSISLEDLSAYADVFSDLNIAQVLHKSHTSLSQLLAATQQSLTKAAA